MKENEKEKEKEKETEKEREEGRERERERERERDRCVHSHELFISMWLPCSTASDADGERATLS